MTETIRTPYLLFLGDAPNQSTAKTATGIAHWRPDICVGEFRYDDCVATTGLPRMDLAAAVEAGAKTIVIGCANAGGVIHERWVTTLREAIEHGLDVASGMHIALCDVPELRDAAEKHGRKLHDVRLPPKDLPVGTGAKRSGRRILTVGTDCSIGKMFTALAIERELQARGANATFRATGQTGIFIAGSGISVDAVVADFISGATEQLAPAAADDHWDVIEGQGSLFHPAFAGVSLGLLHGAQPDTLIMCHHPTRTTMRAADLYPTPDLLDCIRFTESAAKITAPDAKVRGVALNTSELDDDAAQACLAETAERTGVPCVDPVRTGVGAIVDTLLGS